MTYVGVVLKYYCFQCLMGCAQEPNANSEMVGKFYGVSKWRPLTSEFSILNIRLPFNEV